MEIKDSEKVEILRQLLPQFWNEATHWREDSWRFMGWLISSFVILSGISVFSEKGTIFVTFILLSLSISGTIYLIKNYFSYKKRLSLFKQLEKALGFFEVGAYIPKECVIPENIRKAPPSPCGTIIYICIIWLVAIAACLSMWLQNP